MKPLVKALITIILSGLGYFFSTSFGAIGHLMWLAPIPILIYSYTENISKVVWVALIIGFAPGLNEIIGYWPTQIPLQGLIIDSGLLSIQWTLVILLNSILVKKIRNPACLWAYPILITLLEWLQSLSSQGTFNTIAYSQLTFLPAMQIASLTGYFGVSFILSLFASTIAYTFAFYKAQRKLWISVILSLSVILVSLFYGAYRIKTYNESSNLNIRVGLASINSSPSNIYNPHMAISLLQNYEPVIQKLSRQGSEIILLPEEVLTVSDLNKDQIKSKLSLLAQHHHVTLIIGINYLQINKRYNSIWIFNSQGNLVGTYSKHHLVPFIEDKITAGTGLLSFSVKNINAGVAICRDMDYIHPAREYGELNTRILFVPAWDFKVDARVHTFGAITRGIENGYTIVRAAREGYLSVISPTGMVIAEKPAFNNKGAVTLIVDVPIRFSF